ncbi:MAG: ROK family protein [Lentimonas sp.]
MSSLINYPLDSRPDKAKGTPSTLSHLTQKEKISYQNRLLTLRLLIRDTNLSQRKLVKKTHLRASTISNIVNELRDVGIVETGEAISSGRVGPPERALRIRTDAAWACGVELDARGHWLTLINACGEVIASESLPARDHLEDTITELPAAVTRLRKALGLQNSPNGGIAISVPGIIDWKTGSIVFSRPFNLSNFPLQEKLAPLFDVPVWVDRNTVFGAYRESFADNSHRVENFAFFLARLGISGNLNTERYSLGMAMVLEGKSYRGVNNAAGELDCHLFSDLPKNKKVSTEKFLQECGRYLASLINLIDVSHLIVASDPRLLAPNNFDQLETQVRKHLLPIPDRTFTMRRSAFEANGISEGGAIFALHRVLEAHLSEQLKK